MTEVLTRNPWIAILPLAALILWSLFATIHSNMTERCYEKPKASTQAHVRGALEMVREMCRESAPKKEKAINIIGSIIFIFSLIVSTVMILLDRNGFRFT